MMAEAALNQDDFVPDMQRRTIMNLVLLGGAAVPVGWMGGGFIYFLVPPKGASGGGARGGGARGGGARGGGDRGDGSSGAVCVSAGGVCAGGDEPIANWPGLAGISG